VSVAELLGAPGGRDGKLRPIVLCQMNPDSRTVSFYCEHCKRRHTHGDPSVWLKMPGDRVGHRTAHCRWGSGSPFHAVGYELVLAP
jgi:hypothetical protein